MCEGVFCFKIGLILRVVCSFVCGVVGRLVRVRAVVSVGMSVGVCVCFARFHVSKLNLSSFSFIFVFFVCVIVLHFGSDSAFLFFVVFHVFA